jgi:ribosomal protein S18 acetylase RimI-like enzyme
MTASSALLSQPEFSPQQQSRALLGALQVRPARVEDIPEIVALHREAFADKFGGAFGSGYEAQGAAALAATWQRQGPSALRGMLVAEKDNQVIGTTTVRTWDMGLDDSAAAEIAFQETLGVWGAMRSLFALSLIDHRIDRREGFITDVAVYAPFRRAGVAQAMLTRAEDDARRRGKAFLGLYVSAVNTAARALYQRSGFYDVRIRRSLLARLFFGQGRWVYMRKDLT